MDSKPLAFGGLVINGAILYGAWHLWKKKHPVWAALVGSIGATGVYADVAALLGDGSGLSGFRAGVVDEAGWRFGPDNPSGLPLVSLRY